MLVELEEDAGEDTTEGLVDCVVVDVEPESVGLPEVVVDGVDPESVELLVSEPDSVELDELVVEDPDPVGSPPTFTGTEMGGVIPSGALAVKEKASGPVNPGLAA